MRTIILISLLFATICVTAQKKDSLLATTPPMGWNSYNCYGAAVHEDEVMANADYMATNLKKYGWQYIVIDYCWYYDNSPGSNIPNPPQFRHDDGSYTPWLAMDGFGRLLPNVNKFKSAYGAKGFKPLADYVHSLGLQFGIHVMRGIPRQAVWAKSPVFGIKDITADMIADTSSVCGWLNYMYGLDMKKNGAQAYLNSIVKLYADWGVDFIKVDDLSLPYSDAEIEGYRNAITHSGRPMVFSLSPGATPIDKSTHVKKYGNMWRMANDFWDNWEEILKMFDYAKTWEAAGVEGGWPDCDMMQIGKLAKRGPVGVERYSRFTEEELYTHFTFWSIFKSPLLLGGNLPENRELETKLITNEEVIAVNQQGINPRQLYKKDGSMVWVSQLPNSKNIYVALFNISDITKDVSLLFSDLHISRCMVRDLWKKEDLGMMKKQLIKKIKAHGAAMYKLEVK